MKSIRIATILVFIASAVFYIFGRQSVIQSDATPPKITAESDFLEIEAGSDETELLQGLTAIDDQDGDITSEILIGNISDFTEKGTCMVQYLVFDENNNVGEYERAVHFASYISPRFMLTQPFAYTESGDLILSDRLGAEDVLDGDITGRIRYIYSDIDRTKPGTYELTASVKNQHGDEVQETFPVNIISREITTNQIQLDSYLIYVEKGSEIHPEDYIKKAVDSEGNEISKEEVRITAQVNTKEIGSGQFCYEIYNDDEVISTTYLTVIVTDERG